jgi:RNA polymerase sigma-70 factor, ECF subfamily
MTNDSLKRFNALVMPHLDSAYNLARWLTGNTPDAEDLVQEALLRALRFFDSFRGDRAKPWLLTIVRNSYRDMQQQIRRKRQKEAPLAEGAGATFSNPDSSPSTPEATLLQNEAAKTLDGLIRSLPTDYREIVILREIDELSYREIAAIADIPIGTVMSRLARGRSLLRARWLEREKGSVSG